MNPKSIIALLSFLLISVLALPQTITDKNFEKPLVFETSDGKYIPVSRAEMKTNEAYRYQSGFVTTVQVNINAQGQNMLGDAANEPSIAFDPGNHDNMVIGWRQFDTIGSNFRQAGYGYTLDGGITWTFPGVINEGVFRSDPVLDADKDGNFYYNSLTLDSGLTLCKIFISNNQGAAWDNGTPAQGGDKQWFSVDKTDGLGSGNIYNYWGGTTLCPPHNLTRSGNGGFSFEECSSIPGSPGWGTTDINAQGVLFVCGQTDTNFMVARSSNAQDTAQIIAWDLSVHVSLDGEMVAFGGNDSPNPAGLLGQAIIAIDSSGTETDANVYLMCSVKRTTNADPCDLMFACSTDEGESWSEPIRINDDPSLEAFQWFGSMSVAPDGRIDAVWLDTRNHPGTFLSELYYSYSLDGGITWSINESISESFDPHLGWPQQNKMGDYFDMFSDENGVHLAWAATFNGEQDIYYSFIAMPLGINENIIQKESLSQNFPNPFSEKTSIRYVISTRAMVSIELFDLQGKRVRTMVNAVHAPGNYQIELHAKTLVPGMYFYSLRTREHCEIRKLVILE